MKVAVSYNNGLVAKRFSESKEFKVYDVKKGELLNSYLLSTGGKRGEALAPFLNENGVDVVFCDGIGSASKRALAKECIVFFPGVVGKADHQISAFLKGNLSFNGMLSCSSYGEDEE